MSFILLGILNSQAAGAPAGAGAYDLLETTVLGSDTASVSFTGLGSYTDYKHLQIRSAHKTSGDAFIKFQFNGDTANNYTYHMILGNGSSVVADKGTSQNGAGAAWSGGTNFNGAVTDILDFSDTTKNTTIRNLSGNDAQVRLTSGLWIDTSAITSTTILPNVGNFITGSRFSLYGWKAA